MDTKMDGVGKKPIEPRDIGYGKPPQDKQFRKGHSGNPSGRPKKGTMFKSVSRVLRDSLLVEIEGSVNGSRRKMLRLEAIVAKQVSNALRGDIQAAKLLLTLAAKHIPTHLSIAELMEGRPVFSFTKEEVARFSEAKLLTGTEDLNDPDEEPGL